MIIQIELKIDGAELHVPKRVVDSTYLVEHELMEEFDERTGWSLRTSLHRSPAVTCLPR